MVNIFVIADLHLNHKNIFKYSPCRLDIIAKDWGLLNCELEDMEHMLYLMEKSFIKRWNNTVRKDDHVYILGDLTLGKDKEMIKNFLSLLNGKKHLIRGNHDVLPAETYYECGFSTVCNHSILWNNIILSHIPVDHELVPPGYYNFFGHVHSNTSFNWDRGICVSVEQTDMKPFNISTYFKNN